MTTKLKPVRAWAVAYNGNIDSDKMNWGGTAYTVFTTKREALIWLGPRNTNPNSLIYPVLITPLTPKRKGKKK